MKAAESLDYDVAIVGYGPVGQVLACLLGQRGYRVGVFERWPGRYTLPRACVVDGEIMRTLQSIGVAEQFDKVAVPTSSYIWTNGRGEILLHVRRDPANPDISGWHARSMMYQPDLEELLDGAVRKLPSVTVHQGFEAVALQQNIEGAELHVRRTVGLDPPGSGDCAQRGVVRASYVIGCDGANSFVRQACGIEWEDFGFRADWLVVDFRPHHPDAPMSVPEAGQICDPNRPVSLFRRLGRNHVRWELMLLPGETAAEMERPERIWQLLSPWVSRADGEVVRGTVYTFRSCLASAWRDRRVVLAGDAAHLMPPFLGQGMCTGLRDAANLAWKLDLVLRTAAEDGLLDSYEAERRPHARGVISLAVELGKVVCELDPLKAAERDKRMLGGRRNAMPPFPNLRSAILAGRGSAVDEPLVGEIMPQWKVGGAGRVGRLDDFVGPNWLVIGFDRGIHPDDLSPETRARLNEIETEFVRLTDQADNRGFHDVTGAYGAFFRAAGVSTIVVRPDHYIFAACRTDKDLDDALLQVVRHIASSATPTCHFAEVMP